MKPRASIKTSDEYYAKLIELLPKDSDEAHNTLGEVSSEALLSHISLSREQALDIKERATELFRSGNCWALLFMVPRVVAPTGIMEPETGIWMPSLKEQTLQEEYNLTGYEAGILRESGILPPSERVLAADVYKADIGNDFAGRHSSLYLTDRRLLLVGIPIPPPDFVSVAYRLYYDDWESRPYLDFVDMIWLDKIRSIEAKWGFWHKSIIMQYETKYMKEKLHTFFGPYFFKAKLPSSFSVHEGIITIYLTPYTIVPADPKMRMEELVRRVLEAKAKLISGRKQTSL